MTNEELKPELIDTLLFFHRAYRNLKRADERKETLRAALKNAQLDYSIASDLLNEHWKTFLGAEAAVRPLSYAGASSEDVCDQSESHEFLERVLSSERSLEKSIRYRNVFEDEEMPF